MQIKDIEKYEGWKNKNTDPYGACTFRYAETWANLMEIKIKEGFIIKDIADQTSHDADTEGVTGFMYGTAVSILTKYWEHGEELRKWHNKEYDYKGNGVVNPAIITISKK